MTPSGRGLEHEHRHGRPRQQRGAGESDRTRTDDDDPVDQLDDPLVMKARWYTSLAGWPGTGRDAMINP